MKLRSALGAALATFATASFAHEGHGMPGASHWHATDTAGLLVVGVLAVLAIWLVSRGGK